MGPWLGSLILGFSKGWAIGNQQEDLRGFDAEKDIYAPVREELIYRAAPLSVFPNLPMGATAVTFAADHVLDMLRAPQGCAPHFTAGQLLARFGEVLLGGLMYESAYRSSGVVGAVAAHSLHNLACSWGARARRRLIP